ncbi:DUF7619 domain-containing protein [Flavobacterium dankookense]|uniref:Putative secreted protein (Por secretion system target) n=1 Tax=Flavobacterium dankookense TaxID=706186 RepID=A0A4V3CSJ7_9FLAO|nr:T9SS type A sorting domain-containing protein [Flavobacterium dankookense]TDP60892.1 putative secreted protein (Por secretion system target) [Flavobacterium dankookense]
MKKILILLMLFTGMVNAQIVTIPDANFKAKLIADGFDINSDGEIQQTEAQQVGFLDVSDSNIQDLTGITSFTNLGILYCFNNSITNLNLTGLFGLYIIDCSNNSISTLNLTGVSNLSSLSCSNNQLTTLNGVADTINNLICNNNKLTSFNASNLNNLQYLDISHNKIATFNLNAPNLSSLLCSSNLLTAIDINSFTNLNNIDCSNNKLTALNITNHSALVSINCIANPELVTVNLNNLSSLQSLNLTGITDIGNGFDSPTGNLSNLTLINVPQLSQLNCSYNKIETLNLANLSSLTYLDCSFNLLINLSLNNLPNLTNLTCYVNKFESLDLSNLSALTTFRCGSGYRVNGQITNVLQSLNLTGLSNLNRFECYETLITNLDVSDLTNIEYFYFNGIQNAGTLTSIDVNSLTNLKELSCNFTALTSLDVSNLANLVTLDCYQGRITNLDVNNLLNLKNLNCSQNYLANLNLTNLPLLESLSCSSNQLETLNVSNLTSLKTLYCGYNLLTTLNLNGLIALENLDFSNNNLGLANISGISTNLITLGCGFNNLTSLDITSFPALENLNCQNNLLSDLNLSATNNLKTLNCSGNQLTSLNISNLSNLVQLECSNNNLTAIDTSNSPILSTFQCNENSITSLDLSNNPLLYLLGYTNNPLSNFNVNDLVNLRVLSLFDTQTSVLDVSNLVNLEVLFCDNNLLETIDVSNCKKLTQLTCSNNQLTTLFIKNGISEQNLNISQNPNLQYICADTQQLYALQTQLNGLGMNATVSNSYCSFTPGGNYNTITGLTIFDDNNNGCEITDEVNPFIRLDITDGVETGATVTNIDGSYNYFTNAGNYTITPNVENPTWFNFSPTSANFNFLDNNNNISAQDFCIQAVGIHKDIEVVLIPIDFARPGFDAVYKIVYKNKGNQMHSGSVTLSFDDARLNVIDANPTVDASVLNLKTWNFTNLMPFENRSITVKINVNSPQETPAVNNGDILNFTTSITPVIDDELPSDNSFTFNQIVVGSYDPNDITCIEGETVSPTEIGKYLHYVINFENLGTFYAENVVVRTEIDTTKYDIETLQVMNTSNPSSTRINGNIVEFVFEGINLAAAAGNPPVGGHGNVLFKIKTKNSLQVNDVVSKKANIYFDYNFPIATNDAETTFAALNNGDIKIDKGITIYPNPTNGVITINSLTTLQSVALFDVQGRLMETHLLDEMTTTINITNKAKGIYFLKITSDNGTKVEKIIKE